MSSKKIIFTIIAVSIAVPYLALAATSIPYWPSSADPLISCSGDPVALGSSIRKCTSFCDIIDTSKSIIYFVMTLALFAFAPILFAWGGIMIMTSGANPGNIETGKKILKGTVIGVVIVLLAYTIIYTLVSPLLLNVQLPGFNTSLNCSVP